MKYIIWIFENPFKWAAIVLLMVLSIMFCSCSPNIEAKQARLKNKADKKKPRTEKIVWWPIGVIFLGTYFLIPKD